MSTLVLGSQPEINARLQRRRALGQDHRDEVWEAVYHVAPHASLAHGRVAQKILLALQPRPSAAGLEAVGEFNLGQPTDVRVPDGGWLRDPGTEQQGSAVLDVLMTDLMGLIDWP